MARLPLLFMLILPLLAFLFIHGAIAVDMLFKGDTLKSGEYIEKGPYRLIMQSDCNLVLYMNMYRLLWSSRTDNRDISCMATLQQDGNLVIYSSSSNAVWSSGTGRGNNTYRLFVEDDGNVVLYGGLWATNTIQSRRRLL